jgi:3alpha(or 20beta)-hydroxysteroid dehydrogenase
MLAQKVILLTGGAQGMGEYDAEAMLKMGASVVLTDLADELGNRVAERLSALGPCRFLHHDVSSEQSWQEVVEAALSAFGRIDALVNNAGINSRSAIANYDFEAWGKTLAVNAGGVFLGMKAVFPHMKERKAGSIVNIASVNGIMAARYPKVDDTPNPAYFASKAAVINLTRLGAAQFGPHGVRVNAICPGLIRAPMSSASLADPERIRYFEAAIPFNRFGEREDVANAIAFLASDLSGFINGVALPVDGGYTAKA